MVRGQPSGDSSRFGEILRRYREAAGLSQEALAERTGISPRGLLSLERGTTRKPYPATLRRLADALSLTAQQREALALAVRQESISALPAVQDTTAPLAAHQMAGPSAIPAARPIHNLPPSLSSFIGREHVQAAVRDLLAAHRLVTLVGTGGVGKTRLALAVAEDVLGVYSDGVWLADLAALGDSALVPAAVAQVFGLREAPGRPVLETLCAQCAGKRLLLVLDNCEHLLAACAALAGSLLRAAPELRILATSREPLRLAGEQSYRVPSLSIPDPSRPPAGELAGAYEAVRLFVQRAQERLPDFALGMQNARAVTEVCARLDGIPLAIELAAARMSSMSVEAIAARLDDRFRLLSGGRRDALPRQQTLQATLDWSYDLLSGPERTMLQHLSVFAGGWTLAAAEVVVGAGVGIEGQEVLDLLGGLVDKSLVQIQEGEGGEVRYELLETVRQYASVRLTAAGSAEALRDRHLAWCLAFAEEAGPGLRGPEQERWLDRLEDEHDNLRGALAWARERGAAEQGLRLAGALWRFWSMRGYFGEGRHWLEETLVDDDQDVSAARANALNAAGDLAAEQGDFGQEEALQGKALVLWRALGDKPGIAASLHRLAWVASLQGDYGQAVALQEECLELLRELGDRSNSAYSLSHLGWVASQQGDLGRALTLHEESRALWRELKDKHGIAAALNRLAWVAGRQGDYGRAAALHEEALPLWHELGHRAGIATTVGTRGWVASLQGAYDLALALLEECLALQRELGDKRGMARTLSHLGSVVGRQGDQGRAMTLLAESLRLSRDVGARDLLAEGLESMADLLVACGQPQRAAQLGGAAEAGRETIGMPVPPALQAGHGRLVQAMRAVLGEEAFAAIWAEGRAMTLTEALALALKTDPAG